MLQVSAVIKRFMHAAFQMLLVGFVFSKHRFSMKDARTLQRCHAALFTGRCCQRSFRVPSRSLFPFYYEHLPIE